VVGVGDEIASVLSGSYEWECNCGKRSEREAQEKAEPGQLIAFLSKWKASISVETDLQLRTIAQLKTSCNWKSTKPPRHPADGRQIMPKCGFLGRKVGEFRAISALPRKEAAGIVISNVHRLTDAATV
jgi:hypothetical protein